MMDIQNELDMPASAIAKLIINSNENGPAMIIPRDAMYRLAVALEKAEAQLAELAKQKPVLFRDSQGCFVSKGKGEQLINSGEFVTPYYLRPAPAINLAELVPDEKPAEKPADSSDGSDIEAWFDEGWNACRAAILRNIEEQSK